MPKAAPVLTCSLPPPLVELPEVAAAQVDDAAAALADHLLPGLSEPARAEVVARYRAALLQRAAQGPAVVAVAQERAGDRASASLLSVRLVPATPHDTDLTAAGILAALRDRASPGTQVCAVELPTGPGVLRLRRLRPVAPSGPAGPVVVLDVLAPVPRHEAVVVLDLVCLTVDDLPRHAALAGAVAASLRVEAAA